MFKESPPKYVMFKNFLENKNPYDDFKYLILIRFIQIHTCFHNILETLS
jgi:hypothetical protein